MEDNTVLQNITKVYRSGQIILQKHQVCSDQWSRQIRLVYHESRSEARLCDVSVSLPVGDRLDCVGLKALANEDTLWRTHCCRHKCFPICRHAQLLLQTQILCPDTKNVSDFVQKHFVSATNVSQFAQPKKHNEQQCVHSNVSSFAKALR